jgi:hypothetical protein
VLLYFLTKVRGVVVRASAGLTGERHRTRGAVRDRSPRPRQASDGAEETGFQQVFPGQGRDIGMSMMVPAGATRGEVVRACPGLPALARVADPGQACAVWLRQIRTQMIGETARHAGHAGLLPGQIDGATGL